MIIVLHHVAKQHGRGVYSVQDNIDMAVIEEVSKRRAARRNHHTQTAARCRWNFFELRCVEIAEQLRPLCPGCAPVTLIHRRINVAIGKEDVQQAIIVIVEEPGSPAEKGNGWAAKSRPIRDV